jgi:hypothetical protein
VAEGLTLATETADKVSYLEAVARCGCPEAVDAAARLLEDKDSPQLSQPAMTAIVEITGRLPPPRPDAVRRALQAVADRTKDQALAARAAKLLR